MKFKIPLIKKSFSSSTNVIYTKKQKIYYPVGNIRVPYRRSKENPWQWVDIWNAMYCERIIYIGQALNEEFCNQILATILYLDNQKQDEINIYINCCGGEVNPSLTLLDTNIYKK